MRPKTSVRPPIIAGARRRHLSELLRTWRRQPRRRSRLLFGTLLTLALMSDIGVLLLVAHLLAFRQPITPPPTERRIYIPFAADAELWEPLRQGVIRVRGRTRSFESFCREAVRDITGDDFFEDHNPPAVVVSWMLDADADSLRWEEYPFVRCEDAELRAELYGEENNPSRMTRDEQLHGRYVEPVVVRSSARFREILQSTAKEESLLSPLERQALELQQRLTLWQNIRREALDDGESATAELREAYQSGDKDLFAAALTDFLNAMRHDEDDAAEDCGLVGERTWPFLPEGMSGDACLRVQVLMLLSAYAALTLAWLVAVIAIVRVLFAAPTGERLRRLATLGIATIRLGIVLLVVSALLDGFRALMLGNAWRGWNMQALGTLFVLPACSALLYVRGRGWIPPFALIVSIGMAFPLLTLMEHAAFHAETWGHLRTADAWLYAAGLVNLGLIAHAALRYYFGRQRVFDA